MSLAIFGFIPPWVAILVVSRDFMIVGAVLLSTLMGNPLVIQPLYISKANTAAQILFATLVLALSRPEARPGMADHGRDVCRSPR